MSLSKRWSNLTSISTAPRAISPVVAVAGTWETSVSRGNLQDRPSGRRPSPEKFVSELFGQTAAITNKRDINRFDPMHSILDVVKSLANFGISRIIFLRAVGKVGGFIRIRGNHEFPAVGANVMAFMGLALMWSLISATSGDGREATRMIGKSDRAFSFRVSRMDWTEFGPSPTMGAGEPTAPACPTLVASCKRSPALTMRCSCAGSPSEQCPGSWCNFRR